MTTDLQPFLVNYTKAVLTTAATDLGISVKSADTKEMIINKLNSHPDTVAMEAAVYRGGWRVAMRLQWKTKRVGPGDYVMFADGVPVVRVEREPEGSDWQRIYLDSLFQVDFRNTDPDWSASKRDAVEEVITHFLPVDLYNVPKYDPAFHGLSRYQRWQIVSRIGEVFPSLRWDADPKGNQTRIREIFLIGSSTLSPTDRLRQDMEKYGYDRGDDRDLDVQVYVVGFAGEPDALTDQDAELWAFSEQAEELEQAFNLDVQLRIKNL